MIFVIRLLELILDLEMPFYYYYFNYPYYYDVSLIIFPASTVNFFPYLFVPLALMFHMPLYLLLHLNVLVHQQCLLLFL